MIGLVITAGILLGQENTPPDAKLVHRCESGCSGSSAVMEASLDLLHYFGEPPERVAIRVCSKEPLPMALCVAATDPIYLTQWLATVHKYPSERVVFSRAENCIGNNPQVAATELWAIPKGAVLPASVESVRANQVHWESIGANKKLATRGASNYRAAAKKLIAKLWARPDAVGIVLGYYYKKPTPIMQRRLREMRRLLQQSGLPQDRYLVRLASWNGEFGIDPPDPEPRYPSLSIVEVERNTAHR
jgi:hypothetical protein